MNAIEEHADQLDRQLVDLLGCLLRNVRAQVRLVALADHLGSRAALARHRGHGVQPLHFIDRRQQARVDHCKLHRRVRCKWCRCGAGDDKSRRHQRRRGHLIDAIEQRRRRRHLSVRHLPRSTAAWNRRNLHPLIQRTQQLFRGRAGHRAGCVPTLSRTPWRDGPLTCTADHRIAKAGGLE